MPINPEKLGLLLDNIDRESSGWSALFSQSPKLVGVRLHSVEECRGLEMVTLEGDELKKYIEYALEKSLVHGTRLINGYAGLRLSASGHDHLDAMKVAEKAKIKKRPWQRLVKVLSRVASYSMEKLVWPVVVTIIAAVSLAYLGFNL